MEAVVAARAIFFWSGDGDADFASAQLFAVELVDGFLVVGLIYEFYEAEAAGAAGFAVVDDASTGDFANLLEVSLELIIGSRIGELADKKILLVVVL